MLICDKEQSPSIGIVASSRDQARICLEMCQQYAKSLDTSGKIIKQYRNFMKVPANNGELKVYASDSSNLDGLSQSMTILDEGHAQKDNLLYSVMKSSMGFRQQPLMVQITTTGFLLEGYPCYETYKVSLEILSGMKEDDSFFPFIYMMDPDDNWEDEDNWIKCNPALDVTITREYLRDQATAAKNDSSQLVPILTKNFNKWMNSAQVWVPQDRVVKCMEDFKLEDFAGKACYVGVDLASVSDLTALTVMIPSGDKFYFKNWAFIPRDTYVNHQNHQLYERFHNDGDLIITEGNICDYQLITNKIVEISQTLMIQGIYYDPYNSGQWAIQCTDLGFNMCQFRQGLLSFNNPTKEMEKLILSQNAVFDKSALVLWEFGNVVLRTDSQQNVKPDKATNANKIDNIISSVECLGGYLLKPVTDDFQLFIL
jgi:phage terminase large subunit-like protein